jgi:hypothetical protein
MLGYEMARHTTFCLDPTVEQHHVLARHAGTVNPVFDPGMQQWGFWFSGKWIPLYESGC